MIRRTLAGLPVLVESPSSFRIETPSLSAVGLRSWIQFVSSKEGWTITWAEPGREGVTVSNLRWRRPEHVAEYLIELGRQAG